MDDRELIQLANDRVTITAAFGMVGTEVSSYGGSMKLYCPFGHIYHLDGGNSKSLRIYPESNSAWCFAGCGYFTPTRLLSMDKDISEKDAAEHLLDITGYVQPDYMSRWEALMEDTEKVDTASLAEALKVACSRMTRDWAALQFEDEISGKLAQCLGLLKKVHTPQDADQWLAATKVVMARVIGER